MSSYNQSAGASSSKHVLDNSDRIDDTEDLNWQERCLDLWRSLGVSNIPEPSVCARFPSGSNVPSQSTLWAGNRTSSVPDQGAHADPTDNLSHGSPLDNSILPSVSRGGIEDLEGLDTVFGLNEYGSFLPFEDGMANGEHLGTDMGLLDPHHELGGPFQQPSEYFEASDDAQDTNSYGNWALPPSFFGLPEASSLAIPSEIPAGLASTPNTAFNPSPHQTSPPTNHAMPVPSTPIIDPSLLHDQPISRDGTPPVFKDIDPHNQTPDIQPGAADTTTKSKGKGKRAPKATRSRRTERENVPSIIPAPPSRATRPRTPEAEDEGPARKRRRRCELEDTKGTETRCGLNGCSVLLRASDLDGAHKHFDTHVEKTETKGKTTVKGKKGKKTKKAAKDAFEAKDKDKAEFHCQYIEEDGKKCTHAPWTKRQSLQRHIEGTHYKWSFECPVCGRKFPRRDALMRHRKPSNSRCHQDPGSENGDDDASE
ncbi:hypothetical protein VTO73DRAFT_11237 [Trametes versicolor]